LTSLESDARKLGQAIRLHWGIENGLHSLDVTFKEDDCRVRTGHAPQNLAILRRIALNTLNREQSFQRSTRQKSNRAAMDIIICSLLLVYPNLTMTLNPLVNSI